MQLLHEAPLSRVDCCAGQLGLDPEHNEQRFTPAMETPPVFTRQHWRKTFQWVVLHRKHAVMVATDQVVVGLFQRLVIVFAHGEGLVVKTRMLSNSTPPLLQVLYQCV